MLVSIIFDVPITLTTYTISPVNVRTVLTDTTNMADSRLYARREA